MILFVGNIQNRDKKVDYWLPGRGSSCGEGMRSGQELLIGMGFLSGVMAMFWN